MSRPGLIFQDGMAYVYIRIDPSGPKAGTRIAAQSAASVAGGLARGLAEVEIATTAADAVLAANPGLAAEIGVAKLRRIAAAVVAELLRLGGAQGRMTP